MKKHYIKLIYLSIFLVLLILPLTFSASITKKDRYIIQVSDDKTFSSALKNKVVEEIENNSKYNNKQIAKAAISGSISSKSKKLVIEGIDKETLQKEKSITYVEPDYIVKSFGTSDNWNFDIIGLNTSNMNSLGKNVKVAIFDTGSNNNLIIKGYDFVNEDNDTSDDNGHGTSISQLLKSENERFPLTGAEIYSVKVLDKNGEGYVSDTIEGINWAIENKINIVLMSFGGEGNSLFLKDAIDKAYSQGILFIAASGNDGKNIEIYPASYDSVCSVGSINENFEKSNFSNYGDSLEFVAPGENIKIGNSIVKGTSFSVPHVGIVAASYFSENQGMSSQGIRSLLQNSTLDLGTVGRDSIFGYGLPTLNLKENFTLIDDFNRTSTQGENEVKLTNVGNYSFKEFKDFNKTYPQNQILSKKRLIYEKEGKSITVEIVQYNSNEFLMKNIEYALSKGLEKRFDKEIPYFTSNETYLWISKDYLIQIIGFNNFSYDNELINSISNEYPPELSYFNSSKILISSDFETLSLKCSDYLRESCSSSSIEKKVGIIRYECNYIGIIGFSDLCWEPVSYNGDDDFCTSSLKCSYSQYDCDWDSECESNLICAGPADGNPNDGCCYSGQGFSPSTGCCNKGYTNEFMCNEGNVVRKYIGDNCEVSWNVYDTCSNVEKCSTNACISKTCADFGQPYGSCSTEYSIKKDGNNILECVDQILGLGYFLCWQKTGFNGDDNFCSRLKSIGLTCNEGEYDCDGTSECSTGLVCDGEAYGWNDNGEGCCQSYQNWDDNSNRCNSAITGKVYKVTTLNDGSFKDENYNNLILRFYIYDEDFTFDTDNWFDQFIGYIDVPVNSDSTYRLNPELYYPDWNKDWGDFGFGGLDYKVGKVQIIENNEVIGFFTNDFNDKGEYREGKKHIDQIIRIHADKDYWKQDSPNLPTSILSTSSLQTLDLKSSSVSLINNTDDIYNGLWEGKINISEKGNYTFYFNLTGGIKFQIDDNILIDTLNNFTTDEISVSNYLKTGLHTIKVNYYIDIKKDTKSFWEGPSFSKKILNKSMLIKEDFNSDVYSQSNLDSKDIFLSKALQSNLKNDFPDKQVLLIERPQIIDYSKKPVILINGLYGISGYWNGIESSLNDNSYSLWKIYYPYDQQIKYSSVLLKDGIEFILKDCQTTNKVDIVAHSMGGLVSQGYISNLAQDPLGKNYSFNNNVNKMIMLASPLYGSHMSNAVSETTPFGDGCSISEDIARKLGKKSSPATIDLSVGSEFTYKLGIKNLSKNVTYYTLAGTKGDLKFNLCTEAGSGYNDGVVSLTSASLLNKSIDLYTLNLDHSDFTESGNIQLTNFLKSILLNNAISPTYYQYKITNNNYGSFTKGSVIIKARDNVNSITLSSQSGEMFSLFKNQNTNNWYYWNIDSISHIDNGLLLNSGKYNVYVNGADSDEDIEINPAQTSIYDLTICKPKLINTTWSDWNNLSCTTKDLMNQSRTKIEYDINNCGIILNRTISEYKVNLSCDFCNPNWTKISLCRNDDSLFSYFNDSKGCFAKTNLTSDLDGREQNITYNLICDFNKDGFIGNLSNINTTLPNLKQDKINNTIRFKEGNNSLIEFDFNTTNNSINLANLSIQKQSNESNFGYMIIKGLDLSSQNQTKTVYVNKILNGTGLCIKDSELNLITEISEVCTSSDETWLKCPDSKNGYTCELIENDTIYKISGLKHSGIKEQSTYCGDGIANGGETCSSCPADAGACPPSNGGGSGGGGGGGGGGGSYTAPKTTVKTPSSISSKPITTVPPTTPPIEKTPDIKTPEQIPTFYSRIRNFFRFRTAAVVGAEKTNYVFAGIFIVILIAISVMVMIVRRKKNLGTGMIVTKYSDFIKTNKAKWKWRK